MASLSGGWQMRHPLNVFEQEALEALRRRVAGNYESARQRDVLTTEPNAWRRDSSTSGIAPPRAGTTELFLEMISAPGAVVSLLIDPDPIERASLSRWVKHHHDITQQFQSLGMPKSQKRGVALRRFWNEHLSIYQSASRALGHPDVPQLSNRDLKKMLEERHFKEGSTSEPGDFVIERAFAEQ